MEPARLGETGDVMVYPQLGEPLAGTGENAQLMVLPPLSIPANTRNGEPIPRVGIDDGTSFSADQLVASTKIDERYFRVQLLQGPDGAEDKAGREQPEDLCRPPPQTAPWATATRMQTSAAASSTAPTESRRAGRPSTAEGTTTATQTRATPLTMAPNQ